MKTINQLTLRVSPLALWLVLLSTLNVPLSSAFAQGSQITYQGRLVTNGVPYSGSAEFQFTVWDAVSSGNPIATNSPASLIATVDSNGVFMVLLDFGVNPFNGQPRFLQADVRTVIGPFNTLTPRQALTATPYALRALNLTTNGLAGTYGNAVTFNNAGNNFAGTLTGAFVGAATGDGSGLTNVNAAKLGGLSSASFWKTNGNAGANPTNGAFLGTTDNLPLEFKVNAQRALRLEPTSSGPNVIGGSVGNSVAAGLTDATIGGGDLNRIFPVSDPLFGIGSVINGGFGNAIGGLASASVTIGGCNSIGGGGQNSIRTGGDFDTIAGGDANTIGTNSDYVAITGGAGNTIGADSSFAAIGGGFGNTIGTNSERAVIGGGDGNQIGNGSSASTITGGLGNQIGANITQSVIGGGGNNFIHDTSGGATIAGGIGNQIGTNSNFSTLGGGNNNHIANNAQFGTIPGGDSNSATNFAFAAGRRAKANHQGAFVWGDSTAADVVSTNNNSVTMRASGGYRLFSNSTTNAGVFLAAGGTAWASISDRNAKKDFAAIDSRAILEKLAVLPITQWHYKWEEETLTPHLGPMAQDFKAAFYPGSDDTSITTQEADGVALAAIQGLNQKLTEELKQKETRITKLEQRLEALENLLRNQKPDQVSTMQKP